ncbi:MAG: DUF1292 domain-containing protein [Clostridia bacterium]|nr:DUF1292 domain-containing protein [Clostridia bacterium]
MEMEERDFVVFTDDEGNEFELDVLAYFEYEEQEYAILSDAAEDVEEDFEVYIMKVVVNGEEEEFLPADDDKMDILAEIAEELLAGEDDECDCGCDCDGECDGECDCDCDCDCDGECDCECGGEKECGCSCEK